MSRDRLVLKFVGTVLLAAAALKAHGLAVDPVSPIGTFSAPWFQAALIQAEVLLGLWLLSGAYPAGAWLAAFVTFAGFSVISLLQGWVGQASCGCFGRLPLNPWYAFGLDLVVLTALALARPSGLGSLVRDLPGAAARTGAKGVPILGASVAVLAILGVAGSLWRGSPTAALAYLRGERISVAPSVVDLGDRSPGEARQASVELTNRTDRPLRVLGGTNDCACTVLHDLPLTIPPGETRAVNVQVRLPAEPGQFTRALHLLVGDEQLWKVRFYVTGRSRK